MDPFGLDVENGARVQPKTRFLLPVVGELYLVLDFDLKKKRLRILRLLNKVLYVDYSNRKKETD